MDDLTLVSGDGLSVTCHKVMAVALGPFLDSLFRYSDADQIILPDFKMNDVCGLMNLLYTGE